jgi:hypothetical protein
MSQYWSFHVVATVIQYFSNIFWTVPGTVSALYVVVKYSTLDTVKNLHPVLFYCKICSVYFSTVLGTSVRFEYTVRQCLSYFSKNQSGGRPLAAYCMSYEHMHTVVEQGCGDSTYCSTLHTSTVDRNRILNTFIVLPRSWEQWHWVWIVQELRMILLYRGRFSQSNNFMKSKGREQYETQIKYFHCTALYLEAVTLGV